VPSAANPSAAERTPRKPTTAQTAITFLSIPSCADNLRLRLTQTSRLDLASCPESGGSRSTTTTAAATVAPAWSEGSRPGRAFSLFLLLWLAASSTFFPAALV
jgi:hypothetical protein